ncbi:active breakpoint cluster region-related protein-like [Sphaeramia orbicularis]|uniref:active breakpoint cluster region-related protein-like n=1 Tax=Sphaeramia orbicularis TaxID=375764 RepID=UPI00117F962C|nr:active breakpoint cluster region-related protein-like [Sphaeramia orbicularis]
MDLVQPREAEVEVEGLPLTGSACVEMSGASSHAGLLAFTHTGSCIFLFCSSSTERGSVRPRLVLASRSRPAASEDEDVDEDMDVYQEAVEYLLARQVDIVVEAESDILEEEVFHEEVESGLLSPLNIEGLDLPDTPTPCSPEEMLDRRLVVLKGILEGEEVYLNELEALLTPMKALRASAGTSQPVLSSQEVHTVFYQVPELRDLHQNSSTWVNQIGLYGGFIENYEDAVEVVPECTNSDPRFRTLAQGG